MVSGDKIRMTQVLINLSKMAQKYQRQSGGDLEIKVAYDYGQELLKMQIMNVNIPVRDES